VLAMAMTRRLTQVQDAVELLGAVLGWISSRGYAPQSTFPALLQ
jgi:hypothetical protein